MPNASVFQDLQFTIYIYIVSDVSFNFSFHSWEARGWQECEDLLMPDLDMIVMEISETGVPARPIDDFWCDAGLDKVLASVRGQLVIHIL